MHKRPSVSRMIWALLVGVLAASACGANNSTAADGTPGTDAPAATSKPIARDDAGCPAVPFSGTLSRSAAGGHQEAQRADGEMVDAIAVTRREGIAYTIYLADFAIDANDIGSTLQAPQGLVLVTLAIDELDGITVGRPFGNTENTYPFVIIDSGGGASDSASGHTGQEMVIGLSSTMICLEIDYQDDVKAITGTVSARIVPFP